MLSIYVLVWRDVYPLTRGRIYILAFSSEHEKKLQLTTFQNTLEPYFKHNVL